MISGRSRQRGEGERHNLGRDHGGYLKLSCGRKRENLASAIQHMRLPMERVWTTLHKGSGLETDKWTGPSQGVNDDVNVTDVKRERENMMRIISI